MPKPIKSTDLAKALGRVLRGRRHKTNMSAEAVADGACVSRRSYADWETGKSLPKLDGLTAIAGIYKVEPSDLLREAGL